MLANADLKIENKFINISCESKEAGSCECTLMFIQENVWQHIWVKLYPIMSSHATHVMFALFHLMHDIIFSFHVEMYHRWHTHVILFGGVGSSQTFNWNLCYNDSDWKF